MYVDISWIKVVFPIRMFDRFLAFGLLHMTAYVVGDRYSLNAIGTVFVNKFTDLLIDLLT